MISRTLLSASVIGLSAGVAAGVLTSGTIGDAAREYATPAPLTVNGQRDRSAVPPQLSFPGDDGRISRVLSALHQPVRLRQRFELAEAMAGVRAEELPALVKHAESLPKESGADLLTALVERWFALDPNAAQEWVRKSPMEWAITKVWARSNPKGAFEAAAASKEWWSSLLLSAALDAMHGDDVQAKAAMVQSLPAGSMRDSALATVLANWASTDPAAAYAAIAQYPFGRQPEYLVQSVLRQWADRDPAGALEKLSEILPTLTAGVLGNEFVTDIATRIAAKDPMVALEWLSTIPEEFRSSAAVAAVRSWAGKEPIAALEWCMENGVDVARPRFVMLNAWQQPVLGEAMASAPEKTFAFVQALPPGAERDRLLESAFMAALVNAPKDQLFAADGAMAWAFYDDLPADAKVAAAARFGETLARKGELKHLTSWVQRFPPGEARANALRGAMSAAYGRDASSAEVLLQDLSPGAERDAALRGVVNAMGRTAPSEAAARALQISDSVMQQDALEEVLLPWLKADPAAGRKWLEGAAAVPAAWKQEWLQRQ